MTALSPGIVLDGRAVEIERRVEWVDTDAAGHHHHSAVLRWVEAAEAALLREHGLDRLFGTIPRVHYEADYHQRLLFGERVRVRIALARLGERSMRLAFEVYAEDGGVAASGNVVTAHASLDGGAVPWPEAVRSALGRAPEKPQ